MVETNSNLSDVGSGRGQNPSSGGLLCHSNRSDPSLLYCRLCGQWFPDACFHRNRSRTYRRGRQDWCRQCTQQYRAARRVSKPRKVKAPTPLPRYLPKMRVKLGRKAISMTEMVKHGLVVKLEFCQRCGTTDRRILGHHEDYSSTRRVIWLCDRCHHWMHRVLRGMMPNEWEMPIPHEAELDVARLRRPQVTSESPLEIVMRRDEREVMHRRVADALASLSYREREIIKLRYGIGDGTYTLEEVGRRFKVTRERVRQIEAKALRTLHARAHESGLYV